MITPSFSPTATERVLPRMALDFTTGVLDSRVTIARALNTATRINASGNIEVVNANLPRFDYDPVTLAPKGLLIEEARTNVQYPATPQSVTGLWANVNSGVQTLGQPSPDGGNNATLVTSNGSAESGYRAALTFNTSTTYTWSAYVKRGTARYVYMRALCVSGTPSVDGAWFDIQNGVVATKGTGITSTSITPAANGFYRIVMTATTPGAIVNQLWDLRAGNADGAQTSVNGQTMTYFGAQVEVGAFATSYIPTTTTSLTRNADQVVMTGTNFSDWYNASEGAFVASGYSVYSVAGANPLIYASDGTENNYLRLLANNVSSSTVNVSGVAQANFSFGSPTANSAINDYVLAYKLNSFCAAYNSSTGTDVSGTLPVVDRLQIGQRASGTLMSGTIKRIYYYNIRLTNNECLTLSQRSIRGA